MASGTPTTFAIVRPAIIEATARPRRAGADDGGAHDRADAEERAVRQARERTARRRASSAVGANADSTLPTVNATMSTQQQAAAVHAGAERRQQGRADHDAERVRGDGVPGVGDRRRRRSAAISGSSPIVANSVVPMPKPPSASASSAPGARTGGSPGRGRPHGGGRAAARAPVAWVTTRRSSTNRFDAGHGARRRRLQGWPEPTSAHVREPDRPRPRPPPARPAGRRGRRARRRPATRTTPVTGRAARRARRAASSTHAHPRRGTAAARGRRRRSAPPCTAPAGTSHSGCGVGHGHRAVRAAGIGSPCGSRVGCPSSSATRSTKQVAHRVLEHLGLVVHLVPAVAQLARRGTSRAGGAGAPSPRRARAPASVSSTAPYGRVRSPARRRRAGAPSPRPSRRPTPRRVAEQLGRHRGRSTTPARTR